ncbi:MAG: hypothetical protein KDD61_14880 [Bdellovibrionales bacterium]|nr:hypothetical protein [Bdellovibrionales bacterium]
MKIPIIIRKGILLSTIALTFASSAESNRNKVMDRLEKGWEVAYGDPIDHEEELRYAVAVATTATCVAGSSGAATSGCYSALNKFFSYRLIKTARRIVQEIDRESLGHIIVNESIVLKHLAKALKNKTSFKIGSIKVKAGLATYNHWRVLEYNEPRTFKCKKKIPLGGWTWGLCGKVVKKKRKIPLPNTFQPYVRYRISR